MWNRLSANCPLFETIHLLLTSDDFKPLVPLLVDSVNRTAQAKAEVAVIPANTAHIVFDNIEARITIPLLSILHVVNDYCLKHGYRTVGIRAQFQHTKTHL
jgi:aspartate racemase